MRKLHDLPTPALIVDGARLEANLATMASARPGAQLRPHVKAHKSTALTRRQRAYGHTLFCGATIRELEGLAAGGLGEDLLLANEVLDASRLGALVRGGARVTVAADSEETIEAARRGGVPEVLIDVNVGLPRCGCPPQAAGDLAEKARRLGLGVRGVMGYEGHVVGQANRSDRERGCAESMQKLLAAHRDVGGEVVSAGGTGTYDCNRWATEIQAGSYVLMDTAYHRLGLLFAPALWLLATVISVSEAWAVADCGLKALGMDHGNPAIPGARVLFCSDEHLTFVPGREEEGQRERAGERQTERQMASQRAGQTHVPSPIGWTSPPVARVGDRIRILPAHVDPTVAYHERFYVVDGEDVVDEWAIDLRGW